MSLKAVKKTQPTRKILYDSEDIRFARETATFVNRNLVPSGEVKENFRPNACAFYLLIPVGHFVGQVSVFSKRKTTFLSVRTFIYLLIAASRSALNHLVPCTRFEDGGFSHF